jgi:hypothetical protein
MTQAVPLVENVELKKASLRDPEIDLLLLAPLSGLRICLGRLVA